MSAGGAAPGQRRRASRRRVLVLHRAVDPSPISPVIQSGENQNGGCIGPIESRNNAFPRLETAEIALSWPTRCVALQNVYRQGSAGTSGCFVKEIILSHSRRISFILTAL